MLNQLNAPPEPAEGGAPFPPPPPPASIPFHQHVRRGPELRFSERTEMKLARRRMPAIFI